MSDSEEPSRKEPETAADTSSHPAEATLEQARKFLDEDTVRSSTPEKRREFLKTKGFGDAQITQLFAELDIDNQPEPPAQHSSQEVAASSTASTDKAIADTPPIITYPEFLTTPTQPPPLITPSRLANILTVTGTLWALVYGTAGLVVSPMVDNLNSARTEYHSHVGNKLDEMNEKLAKVVSKVPSLEERRLASGKDQLEDGDSVTSDPTELFHRDIGTQTSPPPSLLGTSNKSESEGKPIDVQSRRLAELADSLRELKVTSDKLSDKTKDLTLFASGVRENVDEISYSPTVYSGLSFGRTAEPDDEFKKTKDAIRGVKGLFLGSRSFPAVTR